jgi:DNA-binding transcriptional MerR regulator
MPAATFWTLDELTAAVERALAVGYDGQLNGQVRDVPDRRTIRYYTTLGLIDRPAEMRGRTALYGRRHLLQLVSIKRLQADGLSLTEVQQRLLGCNNGELAQIARLTVEPEPPMQRPSEGRHAERFWRNSPAPVAAPLLGVPLTDGVTLLLPAARPPNDEDLSELRQAAQPLLDLLRRRNLLDDPEGPSLSHEDAS